MSDCKHSPVKENISDTYNCEIYAKDMDAIKKELLFAHEMMNKFGDERDELKAKLTIAIEALKIYLEMGDCYADESTFAREALEKMGER